MGLLGSEMGTISTKLPGSSQSVGYIVSFGLNQSRTERTAIVHRPNSKCAKFSLDLIGLHAPTTVERMDKLCNDRSAKQRQDKGGSCCRQHTP